MNFQVYSAFVFVTFAMVEVNGHGRLLEPPSRSSMFRFAYSDPMLVPYRDVIEPNYNDNQLNCGGRDVQISNGGKCGVCGDSYTAPVKENEAGGKYALGIITRNYQQGQMIDVTVEITAAHKGYFEFRLCPWNDVHTPVTHQCLNENLLTYETGETTHHLPEDSSTAAGFYHLRVQLPQHIMCSQCVLQWRYRTGNSWGVDESGQSGLGYGPQEEFYGCSDVSITSEGASLISTSPTKLATTTTNKQETTTESISTAVPEATLSTTTTTTTQQADVELYPDVDCSKATIGQPIFRDCHSFFICAFTQYNPFIFACPPGTVCDPTNGECKHPSDVPYCNNQ